MIIDIHTHAFPGKIAAAALQKLSRNSHTLPFTDGTEAALQRSMARAGIDLSVILPVATAPRQVMHINDSAAGICENSRETGLFSLGCMHPDFDGYKEELARLARLGIPGIKIHPVYQETDMDDIRFLRIFDRIAELGMFVLAHAGYDIGLPGVERCSPPRSLRVIRRIPQLKLVLAHMGGWQNWDTASELLADTQVLLDMSFATGRLTPLPGDDHWAKNPVSQLTPPQFLSMVRRFGADRILFGTDCPWADQKTVLADLLALPLTAEEKEAILGENAKKLLGI